MNSIDSKSSERIKSNQNAIRKRYEKAIMQFAIWQNISFDEKILCY